MNKFTWISQNLEELKKEGLYNEIRTIDSAMGPEIVVNGKKVLNFCSNNYLGLADNERLKKAAKKAIDGYGIGPTAVRSIAGTTSLHIELENKLAEFKKAESVVTFQSGFNANIATIPALTAEGDLIFSDELNHASIIDACRLSKAEVVRYKHGNPKDLEEQIKNNGIGTNIKRLIVTDGVFSMDGDIAPLPDLLEISEKYNAILMVDDAHGEGVLGNNGRGIVDHFKLHGKVDIEVGTLSKAFAVVGGLIAGRKEIVDWLRQRARPFLFSSAMTIPDTAACIEAVNILSESGKLVETLWKNADYFKSQMKKAGFDTGKSQTPIVPVMLGEAKLAKDFSKQLFENGIFAMSIVYPTVPLGTARIRVMMSASHSKKNLDNAIDTFKKVGRELKVVK